MSPQTPIRSSALREAFTSGARLGCYEIVSLLGAGTMGEVYRALDTKETRQVALKILLGTGELNPDRLASFLREAQILASVSHPNIAAIYGVEEFDIGPALVLELVEGPTLADRIVNGMMPLTTSLSIASQLTAAVEAVHERGVIHRDLKPGNVMVTSNGIVKLVDFGVATTMAEQMKQRQSHATDYGIASAESGVIVGTPSYMSPEQTRGECVDQRTDIWALGCVLYELVTGARAFAGETMVDTFAAVRDREPDLRRVHSSLPTCVCELLRACLEKKVNRRLRDIVGARTAIEEARQVVERSFRGPRSRALTTSQGAKRRPRELSRADSVPCRPSRPSLSGSCYLAANA